MTTFDMHLCVYSALIMLERYFYIIKSTLTQSREADAIIEFSFLF